MTEDCILQHLESIGNIAKQNNTGEYIGSTLLHRHFELKPDEIVLWKYCNSDNNMIQMRENGEIKQVEKYMQSKVVKISDLSEIKVLPRVAKYSATEGKWVVLEAMQVSENDLKVEKAIPIVQQA